MRRGQQIKQDKTEAYKALGAIKQKGGVSSPSTVDPFSFATEKRAEERQQRHPVLCLEVALGNGRVGLLGLHRGDDPAAVVSQFSDLYSLGVRDRDTLLQVLLQKIETHVPDHVVNVSGATRTGHSTRQMRQSRGTPKAEAERERRRERAAEEAEEAERDAERDAERAEEEDREVVTPRHPDPTPMPHHTEVALGQGEREEGVSPTARPHAYASGPSVDDLERQVEESISHLLQRRSSPSLPAEATLQGEAEADAEREGAWSRLMDEGERDVGSTMDLPLD
ncbi:hypothetical protein KIPB_001455 [Kipferlia bialata]|uniref:Uncharacterized protein n=1 Tax=Kipferlia bialata TaxID=797122 RepID=A0A9K3CQ28_9EUKA|nr:hypothetical protein KIPB_001455 [Kipferlia bialata]|eukprot:g1455.t1